MKVRNVGALLGGTTNGYLAMRGNQREDERLGMMRDTYERAKRREDEDADIWGDIGDIVQAMRSRRKARVDDAQPSSLPPIDEVAAQLRQLLGGTPSFTEAAVADAAPGGGFAPKESAVQKALAQPPTRLITAPAKPRRVMSLSSYGWDM